MTTPPLTPPPSSGPPIIPQKKSGVLPWVFGGCGCLTILVILAIAGFAYFRYRAAQNLQNALTVHRVEAPAPSSDLRDGPPTTTGTAPASWRTYDSRADKLRPDLQSHFVAFSFSYPSTFTLSAKRDGIFVDINKFGSNGSDVAERFTVSWYEADYPDSNKGSAAVLDRLGKEWKTLMPQFTWSPISTITRKIDGVMGDGATWGFTMPDSRATFVSAAKAYVLHQPGRTKGVRIDQYGTWIDSKVKSAADVGKDDDLASILATFKFLPD